MGYAVPVELFEPFVEGTGCGWAGSWDGLTILTNICEIRSCQIAWFLQESIRRIGRVGSEVLSVCVWDLQPLTIASLFFGLGTPSESNR